MATVKFSDKITHQGSNMVCVNVDRNGIPFGQLFTFRDTKTDKYPWTAKTLKGDFVTFEGNKKTSFEKAKNWIASRAA